MRVIGTSTTESGMKFSIFLIGESPDGNAHGTYSEMLQQAELAEALGFDAVWLAEHHGSNYGVVPAPYVMGTAIAQRTERIRIGTMVSILPFTHPVHTAEDYAMLDVLSGGRLNFGTGRGYQPREFDMFGKSPAESRELFVESLEIIDTLWHQDNVTYRGKHYSLADVELHPKPLQERVPIYIAALSPESFELAAGRGYQVITQPSLRQSLAEMKENFRQSRQVFLDRGWNPADVAFPMNMITHIAETAEQAREEVRSSIEWYLDRVRSLAPGADGRSVAKSYERYKVQADDLPTFEKIDKERIILVDDPEGARKFVQSLVDEIELNHMTLTMRIGGLEPEAVERSMRLWAEEVMPAFAAQPDAVAS
jgi:natural product biosynthesis luciferase-like monooxygenase protein